MNENNARGDQNSLLNSNQILISGNEMKQPPQPEEELSAEVLFQQALEAHALGDIKYAKDSY